MNKDRQPGAIVYALRITCKEAKAFDGTVMTKAGTIAWASESDWFWSSEEEHDGKIPKHICVFDTFAEADKVRKTWKAWPWYYNPATIEVATLVPMFKMVQDGWKAF
jgi:hypothetical protein